MTTFLYEAGIDVEPIHVAMWGIPTAVSAFVIHAWRLRRLDKSLASEMAKAPAASESDAAPAAVSKQGV
jgi:uncharacterized membrane protein